MGLSFLFGFVCVVVGWVRLGTVCCWVVGLGWKQAGMTPTHPSSASPRSSQQLAGFLAQHALCNSSCAFLDTLTWPACLAFPSCLYQPAPTPTYLDFSPSLPPPPPFCSPPHTFLLLPVSPGFPSRPVTPPPHPLTPSDMSCPRPACHCCLQPSPPF